MDEEPIDFSALDPKANPARWQSLVDGVMDRIETPGTVGDQLNAWGGRALLLAAACVVAVWAAALLRVPAPGDRGPEAPDAAHLLLTYSATGEAPAPETVLAVYQVGSAQ